MENNTMENVLLHGNPPRTDPLRWEEFGLLARAIIQAIKNCTEDEAFEYFTTMQDDLEVFFDNLFPGTADRALTNAEEERKQRLTEMAEQYVLLKMTLWHERERVAVMEARGAVPDRDRLAFMEQLNGTLRNVFPVLVELFLVEMGYEAVAHDEGEGEENELMNRTWQGR
ncbi:MAG: hypothetical protein MMC33_004096 [Icmadophila ericetorum]|nr:hypothetical protein [Icmadophila ericetorum]